MSFRPFQTVSAVCLILGLMLTEQATTSLTHLEGRARVGKQGLKEPKSNGKFEHLGCTFEDSNYKTIQTNQPIWQKQPTSEQLDITALHELKKDVKESFSKAVIATGYNSVDPFIWFMEAYIFDERPRLTNGSQDLLRFFNEYNVPYYADENSVGILIQTFDKMEQGKAYLASAYVAPKNLNTADLNKGYPELKKKRFQDHVAGVIKFMLGTREGYILMDPGVYQNHFVMTPFAVVLMNDQKSPHEEIIWGVVQDNLTFTMGNSNDMWVIVNHPDAKESGLNQVVYYLGQTYCSFLESTTKGLLLRPDKAMIHFDEQANPTAFLTLLTRVQKNANQFILGRFIEKNKPYKEDKELVSEPHVYNYSQIVKNYNVYKDDNPMVLKHLNERDQEEIEKNCELLGLTTKTLVERMYFYYHRIYEDSILSRNWVQIASTMNEKQNGVSKLRQNFQSAKEYFTDYV